MINSCIEKKFTNQNKLNISNFALNMTHRLNSKIINNIMSFCINQLEMCMFRLSYFGDRYKYAHLFAVLDISETKLILL